jgi:hypothetical protein
MCEPGDKFAGLFEPHRFVLYGGRDAAKRNKLSSTKPLRAS